MKKFLLYLFVLTLFTSCGDSATQTVQDSSTYTAPELLDRPTAIHNGKEWDNVQNIYGNSIKAIRTQPEVADPYLKLAEVYITEARITGEHGHYYPAALEVLEHLLSFEKEPTDERFRALSLKASVMLSQHEFAEALEVGKQALKLNTYNAQIYGVMVDALVELGRYDEAVKMADRMVSIRPDLRSYSRISYLREIHGQVDGALEAMRMAVKAGYPGYEQTAWARLTMGDLYQTYGHFDKAENEYKMILAERENYPFAIAALADMEIKKGNAEEAEKLLKEAAEIIPEVGFYQQLAGLYQDQGRQSEAEKLFPEIEAMLADDVEHGHNMNLEYARYYYDLNTDYEKALEYAQTEYEKRPDNIDVNRLLAVIHLARGEYDQAQNYLIKADRTKSKHPELLLAKGLMAIHQGNRTEGLEDIRLSMQYDPHQSSALAEQAKKMI